MTTRYSAPSVEAIQEDSEDELMDGLRSKDEETANEQSYRHSRLSMDGVMAPTKANTGRERRRKHKSKEGGSKHQSRSQGKNAGMKRGSGPPARDSGSDEQRMRHRHTYPNQSTSSTSSSSEEDEPVQDHREVLAAARAKLTSPSMVSTFTSLTTSTNKSSGSSGSNSTVTQASITKRSSLGKRPEIAEAPMSPAVPDPPNVFAFLDNESEVNVSRENEEEDPEGGQEEEEEEEEEEEHEDEDEDGHGPQWRGDEPETPYNTSALPPHLSPNNANASASSSASSSFHGSDHFSEPAADNDTDRSTSPERSIKDHASDHEPEPEAPTDRASARMASQIAAAQQRQNLYVSMQNFGTPNMPRGNTPLPHIPSTALSPRYVQHIKQHSLPRAEKLPVTGYELLATRLSSYNSSLETDDGTVIKPIYRKFGALNHRLLLHLQDELSELEEQLHRLDNADTQSRRAGLGGRVVPASRRAAAMQGGELQWHKTDVLGKIGFKLAQYSSYSPPTPEIITNRSRSSTLLLQHNTIPLPTSANGDRHLSRVLIDRTPHCGSRNALSRPSRRLGLYLLLHPTILPAHI